MRKLVLFGDSWTNGFTKEDGVVRYIEDNLGKQISDRLGINVGNNGEEGSSNQKIANSVIRYIQKHDCSNIAMFIVWTEKLRMPVIHRRDDNGKFKHHHNDPEFLTHMTLKQWRDVVKVYPEIGDFAFTRMLMEHSIHSVRMVLKENNIPYLFSNSIDNFWMYDEMNYFHGKESKSEFVGGGQLHHTLLDILLGFYKNPKYEKENYNLRQKREITKVFRMKPHHDNHIGSVLTKCEHPTKEGVGVILDNILPEIEQIIKRKKNGTTRF